MQKTSFMIEKIIKWFVYGMLILTTFIVLIAIFSRETEGEANIGSFDCLAWNDNWVLERHGESELITLPVSVDTEKGEILSIDGKALKYIQMIMETPISMKFRELNTKDIREVNEYY